MNVMNHNLIIAFSINISDILKSIFNGKEEKAEGNTYYL
jgi:hypothetical protein